MTPLTAPSTQPYTLSQRLSEGAIPVREALQYAARLAEALRKVHDSGHTHGGLAPAAITITETGLEIPTAPEIAVDAGPYTAPEVLAGGTVDVRSDVFSLGAILYEMLTGRRPFEAAEFQANPAAALNPQVDRFLSQCVAADPAARFARMQRVLLELKLLAVAARRAEVRAAAPRKPLASVLRYEMKGLEDRIVAHLAENEKAVTEIRRGFQEVAERIEERVDALGQRLAAVEQDLDCFRQRSTALEENIAAGFHSCQQTLQAHEAAIESSRAAAVQTDNLVERVVDALDLLQSSVLDRDEGQGTGVN